MTNETLETTVAATPDDRTARKYRPRLAYHHPNAKGSGSAVTFELQAAEGNVAGAIYVTVAAQKTCGHTESDGARVFPTFDWASKITVKLDIDDLSRILAVFRGIEECISDGKGLYHSAANGNTIIRLEHRLDPQSGYLFEVSRKTRDAEAMRRVSIFFSPMEALGLSLALEQSMGLIAFGQVK